MILESTSHCSGLVLSITLLFPAFSLAASVESPASETARASSVDLRPVYAQWGLPLRSQGARGTCSVFAMAGAMEYALASQQRRATVLSVEFLNWASNQVTGTSADGSFFSDLWAGFLAYGACPEGQMPYQASYDAKLHPTEQALRCAAELRTAGLQLHWIKPWDVKTGLTEEQFLEIKNTLARQWPVCAGLRWPKQPRWTGQLLEMAPPEGVVDGHSVLLVGFRDDPKQPGGGVFLMRNSGSGVQDGAMSYEYVRAYTNDAVWIDYVAVVAPASQPAVRRD